MAIEEKPIIQDNEDFAPLTPVGPDIYQGKQVIINADRLIFNARKKLEEDTQGAASTYEGGDIHLFSQNFIGLSTKGSIHLNTGFESEGADHEQLKNYIAFNAPNIFIGMDNKKEYPVEPAVLGNKNQDYNDKLLDFLKKLLDKLSSEYRHTGDRGGLTSPIGDTFEDMREDFDGNGEPLENSIGELRNMLREIKSQHVFLKR